MVACSWPIRVSRLVLRSIFEGNLREGFGKDRVQARNGEAGRNTPMIRISFEIRRAARIATNSTMAFSLVLGSFGIAGGERCAFGQTAGRRAAPLRQDARVQDQAAAKIAKPTAPDPALQREMEEILKLWEKKSVEIETLSADFERIDVNRLFKTRTLFRGQAVLKSPNLACLHYMKYDPAKKDPKNPKAGWSFFERVVCSGDEVYDYSADTKTVSIFPMPKDQTRRAIEEGPLRFLFNMRVAEVKRRYIMDLTGKTDAAYEIRVIPLLKEDKQAFSQAYILLNKKTFLPDAMLLYSPEGKGNTQEYSFKTVLKNKKVDEKFFQFQEYPGYKKIVNPVNDDPANAVKRPAGIGPRQEQPALRPKRGQVDR